MIFLLAVAIWLKNRYRTVYDIKEKCGKSKDFMGSCKEKRRKMDVGGRQDIDCCITKVFSDVKFLYIY
jgi:hypothetical protein